MADTIVFEKVNGVFVISVNDVPDAFLSGVPVILIPSRDNKSITIWAGNLSFPYRIEGNAIQLGTGPGGYVFAGTVVDLCWKLTSFISGSANIFANEPTIHAGP